MIMRAGGQDEDRESLEVLENSDHRVSPHINCGLGRFPKFLLVQATEEELVSNYL